MTSSPPAASTSNATKVTGTAARSASSGLLATEPLLERLEGQRALGRARVGGEQLAVEHQAVAEPRERGAHLGIPAGDVVQRAREEHDAAAAHVRLGADPVVLVLEHERRRQPLDDLGGGRERLRQHEAERVEERQRGRVQRAGTGELRHLTQIAAQQVRPAHGRERAGEGRRERLLDLRLLEPDAQLAEEQANEVARLARPEALQQALRGRRADRRCWRARRAPPAAPPPRASRGRRPGDLRAARPRDRRRRRARPSVRRAYWGPRPTPRPARPRGARARLAWSARRGARTRCRRRSAPPPRPPRRRARRGSAPGWRPSRAAWSWLRRPRRLPPRPRTNRREPRPSPRC